MARRNYDGTFRGKRPKKTTPRHLVARWVESEVVRLKRLGMDFPRIAAQVTLIGRGRAKPITELPPELCFPPDYKISKQGYHKAYRLVVIGGQTSFRAICSSRISRTVKGTIAFPDCRRSGRFLLCAWRR
jgi:hypothetical protein